MAVIEGLAGIEVTITVNGLPLKEHIDTELEEEEGQKTRFVEAVSGQGFEVACKVEKGVKFKGDCISFGILVNGQKASGPFIRKGRTKHGSKTVTRQGVHSSSTEFHRFHFASMDTVTDGHILKTEPSRLKSLGSIIVKIHHKTLHEIMPYKNKVNLNGPGVVSEKALKGQAISHSVGYGETEHIEPRDMQKTSYIDPKQKPEGTFVFKYRSMEKLKAMLIIPRTPSPPPPTPLEERDITTLNPEELRELQKRMLAWRDVSQEQVRVKRERMQEEDNERRRKVTLPCAGDTQLELDEGGGFRESSTASLPPQEREIIEID